MPEYLHPGVYVQEVPSSVKPIEGVSTSTAGFVGVASRGPVPGFLMPFGAKPRSPLITSFTEFSRLFGSYRKDSYLAYSVQNFFDNGGKRAYIVRVVVDDDAPPVGSPPPPDTNAQLAALALLDREEPTSTNPGASAQPTLAVIANSPGAWANALGISIQAATADPDHHFKLLVLEEGAVVEAYDDLSMDSNADNFVDNVVNSRSALVMVKAVVPHTLTDLLAARPQLDSSVSVNGAVSVSTPVLTVQAAASLGGKLSVKATPNGETLPILPTFQLQVIQGSKTLETYNRLSMDPTQANYFGRKVNPSSSYIQLSETTGYTSSMGVPTTIGLPGDTLDLPYPAIPSSVQYPPAPDGTVAHVVAGPGADGRTPGEGDMHFLGRSDLGTGLHAFDSVSDVNIIAIPGQGNDLTISGGMAYCKNRGLQDAFFVADLGLLDPVDARTPGIVPDVNDKNAARDFVKGLSTPNDYGAIYYPWLRVSDPIGRGRNPSIVLPPSGFIAGLYARIDNSRGVFKAPAGTETGLAGALGLCADIGDADQDSMNPIGLNVIRRFPIYGIVSWGTRTLSADAAWRYIPVRRMAIFLRASIYHGIQWAVFEPNDAPLWADLRLNIKSFMLTQFRSGAFQGSTPGDAFFVKCDSATTTQTDIDNGVVNILVGFAPLKPAEFVVLKLSQKVNLPAA
jgi:phage tail sheath protein FI